VVYFLADQPTRAVKPDDAFLVPANTPHAGS